METDRKPFTLDRIARLVISALITLGFLWLINKLSNVLIPFVLALFLAYYINPLVRLLQKKAKIKNRGLAVLLGMVGILLGFCLVGFLVIPSVAEEVYGMVKLLSEYTRKTPKLEALPDNIESIVRKLLASTEVEEFFNDNKGDIFGFVQKIIPGFWKFFSGSINIILGAFGLVIILLYLVFILIDYEVIFKSWPEIIPDKYRSYAVMLVEDFVQGMNTYFRAQASVALIVGILFAIGFKIIGLPLAIILGLFIGLLNMVPYLQMAGFIPATFCVLIHSLETGSNFWVMMGLVLVVFCVVQLIQEVLLIPKIMGNVTGLNPAIILLSLSVWGSLLGIIGMLIALPVTALIIAYYKRFVIQKRLPS